MQEFRKVTAPKGLLLHRGPNEETDRIELMPLGSRVEIIDEKRPHWPHVEWRSPQLGLVRGYAHERWLQVEQRIDPEKPMPLWPLVLTGVVVAALIAAVRWL